MNQIKYKVLPPFEMRMKFAHLHFDAYVPVGSVGRSVDMFLQTASYPEKIALFEALNEEDAGDLSKAYSRMKTAEDVEDDMSEVSDAEDMDTPDTNMPKGVSSTKEDKDLKKLVDPKEDDDDDFFDEEGELL